MSLLLSLRMISVALTVLFAAGALEVTAATSEESGQDAGVYQQEVPRMTTLECAKCHPEVFKTIRDQGGLHRLECQDCHVKFHNFQQGLSWEERMPDCSTCHEPVHGEAFLKCLSCHRNAHAPVASMVGADQLAGQCTSCHASAAQKIKDSPSAHTEISCSDCHHDRHGYSPSCNECHPEPHTPFESNAACMECHLPHTPLDITFGEKVANSLCRQCHAGAGASLAQSDKAHGGLKCVFCHAGQHGRVPTCQECHGEAGPHNAELLQDFESCQDCHGNAHSLTLENVGG